MNKQNLKAPASGEAMPGKTISYLYIELLRDRNAQLSLNERDAIADELAYVLSLREQRETPLTYPPEAASWVAIKGDKPVAVVEKAAYDDLRAIHVALRKQREGMVEVPRDTLEHWVEYWNGNHNESAISDALEHIINEIENILAATLSAGQTKEKP